MYEKTRSSEGATFAVVAVFMLSTTVIVGNPFSLTEAVPEAYFSMSDFGMGTESLFDKGDRELINVVRNASSERIEVLVLGPPHGRIHGPIDRQESTKILERQSDPFFSAVKQIVHTFGGEVIGTWGAANAMKIEGNVQMVKMVATMESVRHLALDYEGAITLWHNPVAAPSTRDGPGAHNTQGRNQVQAEEIWAAGFEAQGVRAAVIDTGIDITHEAFKSADGETRIIGWADCTGSTCNESIEPYDDHGHGTHVAATAFGSDFYDDPTWGRFQERGVAPRTDIIGVKLLDSEGRGSFANALDSLQWAFENNAHLTVNSWGGSCEASASVVEMVNKLNELGMVSIFSAGNVGPSPHTINGPACAKAAISVGAIDGNLDIAHFSSRGPCRDPTIGQPHRVCPHFVAKGVGVRSAIPRDGAEWSDPSGYLNWSGTSMATPHVAGVVALMIEMKDQLDSAPWNTSDFEERHIMKRSALPLPDEENSPNNDYGWGIVRLLPIMKTLMGMDDQRIAGLSSVSADRIQLGDSLLVSFSATNLWTSPITGEFITQLKSPNGKMAQEWTDHVELRSMDSISAKTMFNATVETIPGKYVLRGILNYTWTNPSGKIHHGMTYDQSEFLFISPFMDMTLPGLEDTTVPFSVQRLAFTLNNKGNDLASNTKLSFTIPNQFIITPQNGTHPNGVILHYSDPPPDEVSHDLFGNTKTLVWNVGNFAPEDSFIFRIDLVPTIPGTYEFVSTAEFTTDTGDFHRSLVWSHSVHP